MTLSPSSTKWPRCLPTLFIYLEWMSPLTLTQTFNYLNQAFDLPDLAPWLRRKCLTTLCRICGHRGLLPRSLQILQCYNRSDIPRAKGGYADVWMGNYQGRQVAVKVLRVYSTTDLVKITRVGGRYGVVNTYVGKLTITLLQRFCKEVMTWKILCHSNVLPLLGVTMDNSQFAMISDWMVGGNINEYIKANSDANRFELVRFRSFCLTLLITHSCFT